MNYKGISNISLGSFYLFQMFLTFILIIFSKKINKLQRVIAFKMNHAVKGLPLIGFCLIFLSFSCSTSISLNIDKKKWIADNNGCTGYRLKVYDRIIGVKENLLGLSAGDIIKILGNPNMNELYKRNQKFFVYQITPGVSCKYQTTMEDLFLIFRFNAMGLANEIYLNDKASPTN